MTLNSRNVMWVKAFVKFLIARNISRGSQRIKLKIVDLKILLTKPNPTVRRSMSVCTAAWRGRKKSSRMRCWTLRPCSIMIAVRIWRKKICVKIEVSWIRRIKASMLQELILTTLCRRTHNTSHPTMAVPRVVVMALEIPYAPHKVSNRSEMALISGTNRALAATLTSVPWPRS